MADVTIDMGDRELEDVADELATARDDLDDGTMTVDLHDLDAPTAFAFFEGALDAGYRVTITGLESEPTGHQTVIEMLQDDEIVHIETLTVDLRT
jgi:hypothetical protein